MNYANSLILRQALDLSTDGVLLLSAAPALAVEYANPQFEKLSGLTLDTLRGRAWPALESDEREVAGLREAIAAGRGHCAPLRMRRPDGNRWRATVRAAPLYEEDGSIAAWLCQFLPASSGEPEGWGAWMDQDTGRARERFGRLDRIDASSGLLRYERFRDFVERDLNIARRERRPVSLMLLEIADFDSYRATFGGNAAESCLRMIGKQVTASLRRSTDLCARCDDNSIVAALFGQDAVEAGRLLERICENIDGLRIHNPRGRRSRFLHVRSAVIDSGSGTEGHGALLARLREQLADQAAAATRSA